MLNWSSGRRRYRKLDPDSVEAACVRRLRIEKNGFLREIYRDWYSGLAEMVPDGEKPVLEIGSNGGRAKEFIPNLITSDILFDSTVDIAMSGQSMPLRPGSLRGIVMTDVLHHLPSVRDFFSEAARCLQPRGVVAMIEPWLTPWSRLIYGGMHPEPCRPERVEWEFESSGPLSGANIALPWIVFHRDRAIFEREFPEFKIIRVDTGMPFSYILSGGVAGIPLMPSAVYKSWRRLEKLMSACLGTWAMFAKILLVKK